MKKIFELNKDADILEDAINCDLDILVTFKNNVLIWLESHKQFYLFFPVGGLAIGYCMRKKAFKKIMLLILQLYHHSKLLLP